MMAGCWKMSGGGCKSSDKLSNHDQTNDRYTKNQEYFPSHDHCEEVIFPKQRPRPQRASTTALSGSLKLRRQRKRSILRKSRKHSEGSALFPAGFEDEDEEDGTAFDIHLRHKQSVNDPGEDHASAPTQIAQLRKTRIKKIFLCGRGPKQGTDQGK